MTAECSPSVLLRTFSEPAVRVDGAWWANSQFTDAGEVRITASAANGHFTVSVTDTGPGIPPEEQKRVFEQFHQVDSSNTKAKGGTGLGLAIAKQIVGRIWVESTLGQGATFQMQLPTRAEFRKATTT
ncbi:MAG: ATP-binding protein [Hyphomicrobiaceae bacterium]|nr:MAG: ATP-binding protein [Hyphomicrobiaceae bacterium]